MERVSTRAAYSRCVFNASRALPPDLIRRTVAVLMLAGGLAAGASAQAPPPPPPPIVDPNVNMVRGIGFKATGDPYLQRQNEPSIAVSTRNACHLLAGANDYRAVDIDLDHLPNLEPQTVGDAWLSVFKSYDCGQKWQSELLPGWNPDDTSIEASPLRGFQAGADPTVRAGTNGLFYYSGIVFNRGENQPSRLFVARYQDFNDKERGDSIRMLGVTVVADGSSGQFVDKPWMAVDIPRPGQGGGGTCDVNGQQVPGGNVYLAWARFDGNGAKNPSKIMFARSTDCGQTFKASPISDNQKTSQGAMIAIAPDDGTVYVTWREFARNGKAPSIHIIRSRDGGRTWDKLPPVVASFASFDQIKSESPLRFRTNALPTIAAAPGGRVYIAFAARGYHADARIVLAVSNSWGEEFGDPVVIDPVDRRGHQVMPALAYAAGKLQIVFYDFRDDLLKNEAGSGVSGIGHTVDVRGAWADATANPEFYPAGGESQKISQYARSADNSATALLNFPNLPLYGQGKIPFIGDYIDAQGLVALPVRSDDGKTQEWRANFGSQGAASAGTLGDPYPPLPVFHAAWTDNRDVKPPPPDSGFTWADYTKPGELLCNPDAAGMRNANVYTSRLTAGLYVGSPGNTKPLGYRPGSTTELLQRAFAVFAQNALPYAAGQPKSEWYRLTIANQPKDGVASFRQFDRPPVSCTNTDGCGPQPLISVDVEIPRRSTIARTVYVRAPEKYAQVLVNVVALEHVCATDPADSKKLVCVNSEVADGLKASVMLNPDLTNPEIQNPDVAVDPNDPDQIPQIAQKEVHDPAISMPYYLDVAGVLSASRALAVPKNPDPENPDPENPDPENPDPENPDPENPDPENPSPWMPDPENPDPGNPDPENPAAESPDPENPDPENPDVEYPSVGDIVAIRDIHWTIRNKGNTTSAYHFRPTLKKTFPDLKFQLLVTRRYLVPVINPATCKAMYRTESQVLVNVPAYTPRTPDPENPDPENPDPENPDPENPDPENPDPENPDPENVTFILAPGESATVTLRVFKTNQHMAVPPDEGPSGPSIEGIDAELEAAGLLSPQFEGLFTPRAETAAAVTPQAADTGQTAPTSASAGPDLVVSDPMPTADAATVVPPGQLTLSFTVHNRGTGEATAYTNGDPARGETTIKTRFYLSTDNALSRDDTPLAAPGYAGDPRAFTHELSGSIPPCTETTPADCLVARTQPLAIPGTTLPGQYYVFAIVDDDNDWDDATSSIVDNEVFEAEDYNNSASVGPIAIGYILEFAVQPVDTTQDMYITPTTGGGDPLPVTVVAKYSDGTPVTNPALLSAISVSLGSNPAAGALSGTLTVSSVGGYARFGDLRINNPSPTNTTYTLVASATGAFAVASAGFAILADAPPVATNDTYTMFEDGTLTVPANGVLANDRDPVFKGVKQETRNPRPSPGCPDGWCIAASLASGPAVGSMSPLGQDGSFTYTPPPQFNGPVTFTYRANDGRPGNDTTGSVTINVIGVNDPPSFTKGSDQTVAEDSGPRTVSAWATGISAGPGESSQTVDFMVSSDNPGLFAAAPAVSPTGTLTFTPAPDANGTTVVTVRIQDSGGTANGGVDTSGPQTFVITVTSVNDAPRFTKGPNQSLNEDAGPQTAPAWATGISPGNNEATQTVAFLVTSDNAALFLAQPAIGATGTLTYTPAANTSGTAIVTVGLQDNGGTANGGIDTSPPQTFTITVASVNDAPSFTKGPNQTVNEDAGPQTVLAWATNISPGPNEATQTVAFLVSSNNATLFSAQPAIGATGTLTYTPAANASGTAIVTVQLQDNGGTANGGTDTSATETFSITVTGVNDPPVAVSDSATTLEDTPVVVSVLANDSDPDGDALTVTNATPVTGGGTATVNANNTVTYAPAANHNGTATFTYTVSDGVLTASATVTVTITPVNDNPTAVNDAFTVAEDSGPTTLSVHANDTIAPDTGETLTVTAVTQPASGTVTIATAGTGVIYTPPANFNGVVSFTYTISDGNGGTATASVTVTVTPVNDAPVGVNDTYVVAHNQTFVVSAPGVLANDTDVDGNVLTTVFVKDVLHGTLTLNANGSFTYVPNAGFAGADNFRYRASDGSLASAVTDVNITVLADQFPVAASDAATTAEDTGVVIAVLANDTDADGDVLSVSAVTTPLHGTATITGTGTTVTYMPALNYYGPDAFTYTVSDGKGGTAVGAVSITVTAVNDAPVAVNDTALAIAGQTTPIDVLANDFDAESRVGLAVASSVRFDPPGLTTNPGFAYELAVVPGAGRLYVSTARQIAVYSLATNALERLIPLQGQAGAALNRLDAAAGILYFRHGAALVAVDVRPASPTFNQILTSLTFGSGIVSFAVDGVTHRVYVVHNINAGGAPATRQLVVVDGNPASPSFLSMVAGVPLPGNPIGVAVNGVTNKIYFASNNPNPSLSGLYVVDGTSLAVTRMTLADGTTGAPACYDVVVDPTTNMVYGYGTAEPDGNIVAVDAANGNAVTTIPVANFWSVNWVGKMLAVNTVTHRVYAWSGDFTNPGKLVVIDGDRSNAGTFNTVIAEIPTERDYCDVAVDETANRVVTTGDMGAIVIDGATNTVAGIVRGKQLTCDIAVNPGSDRAYVIASTAGFQVVDTAGTPSEIAAVVTTSEAGGIVVDPERRVAYTTRTLGGVSVLALDRDGGVNPVPGLPTDSGRFLGLARNAATRKIYAANYGAGISGGLPLPGYVAVIDGATGTVIKNVVVGDQPIGLGINETTNRIYVANYGSLPGSISVIDGGTDTVVDTVAAPANLRFLRDLAANTTTNKIYLRSASASSPLWVLDGASHALSPVAVPTGTATVTIIRVNSEKNRIYVGMSDGTLHVLNGANDAIVATLSVGYPSPAVGTQSYVAINEATDDVFVANYLNDELTVLDYDGGVLGTVGVGVGPTAVAVDELTNTVYVSSANDKILAVIDGSTRILRGAAALPYQANFIGFDPVDRRLYTSSGGAQDVGLMVIADDPAGPEGTLIVNDASPGGLGTTEITLDRLVLYRPTAGASGSDTFDYTISDGTLTSGPATVTVLVAPALAITTSSLPNGRTGDPYSQTIAATGGTGARTWLRQSGSLPAGTALDATGTISGTPTVAGAYTFTARVQDSAAVPQVATRVFTIGVGPLVVTTGGLPSGWIGEPYSATLSAAPISGTAVWSLTSGSLPAGLSLSSSGVISGTSNVYGYSNFTVQVTDGSGDVATRSLSILIDAPLQIVTPPRVAVLFQSYSTQYIGGRGTRTWTVDGTLPRGMSLNPTSGLTGTPLETGHFPLTLSVSDCANSTCPAGTPVQTDTEDITLHVAATDQSIGWNSGVTVPFGTTGYSRIAQVVTAGVTGDLVAVAPGGGMSCPWPTAVTAEVRRLTATPPFVPDDSPEGLYASATLTMSYATSLPLDVPVFLPAGAKFAIVLTAAGACTLPTNTGYDYAAGEPFVFDGASWQSPTTFFDLTVSSFVVPPPGLVYTTAYRNNVVATPLLDGRILLVSDTTTAEVYDPAARAFTATANNPQASRLWPASVLLTCPSGTPCDYHGKVLVAGGERYDSALGRWVSLGTAELYDPATNQFTPLVATLAAGRSQFTMTRLLNGTFLVAGGQTRDPDTGDWSTTGSAEIFDPDTMSFTPIGDMVLARRQHTATLISCAGCAAEGKVLIVGGWTGSWNGPGPRPTAELFEPSGPGGTFRPTTGGTVDGIVRAGHTATPLANGNVVIAGGIGWWPELSDTIEIYDVTTDSFTAAGTIAVRRMNSAAVELADGRILLAGGWDRWTGSNLPLASVEIYDPQTATSSAVSSLIVARAQPGIARLGCPPSNPGCDYADDVLVMGGSGGSSLARRSAETVDLAGLAMTTGALPDGQTGQPYPGATLTAVGGTPPYTFSVASGNMPPRLLLEPTGQIHSMPGSDPDVAGAFQFVAQVTDSSDARAFQGLTIRIDALTITMTSPAGAVLNEAYDQVLTATGTGPFTWSIDTTGGGNLPPGLSLSADGRLSGTPTQTGCWNFMVRVRDASHQTATAGVNLCVNEPLEITTTELRDGVATEGYGGCLGSSGGGGQRTWSVVGDGLPAGLSLTSWGCFNGQLLDDGMFDFTAQVADASQVATRLMHLHVWASGQGGPGGDVGNAVTVGGPAPARRVAQIVTSSILGHLGAVRVPASCSEGELTVEIQGVTPTPPARPDGAVVLSTTVTPVDSWEPIVFGATRFFGPDDRFAIVVGSTGTCQVTNLWPRENYAGSGGLVDEGGGWTPLADLGYPDLNFLTLVTPARDLDYTSSWLGGDTAVVLDDGRVVMANGSQIELYDPATHVSTIGPTLEEPRGGHTVTRLADGKIVIIGGSQWLWETSTEILRATAEVYDPATGQLVTAPGRLNYPRGSHQATRLGNGRVLITGGLGLPDPDQGGFRPPFIDAELFDPQTGEFTVVPNPMTVARWGHRATALLDGTVLITGGWTNPWSPVTAEIFDPATNTFAATGDLVNNRANHSATLLADGRVLVAGGHPMGQQGVQSSAEIFDPSNGTFEATGSLTAARQSHAAVLLDDGSVLVAGGNATCCGDPWRGLSSAERFSPLTGTFAPAGALVLVREGATAVRLLDGRAAIIGGGGASLSGRSIEFYDPSAVVTILNATLPDARRDESYTSPPLVATGGTPSYLFSIAGGGLPPGLSLAGDLIVGTPTAIGTFRFTVTVTDSSNPVLTNYQSLAIRVSPLDITTADLPRAFTGKPYSAQLTATGAGTVTWSLVAGQGPLPDGLTLGATGAITGTPVSTGTYNFGVRAQDAAGQVTTRWLSIQVDQGLEIMTETLADGVVTEGYGGCLWTVGGAGPVTFSVTVGVLPPGMTLASWGCFQGQILDGGSFTFTVEATSSGSPSQVTTKVFTIHTWVPDQSGGGGNQANAVTIGGLGQQRVAQIVRAGALGDLVGVRVPVSCDGGGSFTVEIQGVTPTPPFQPDGNVWLSGTATPTGIWAPVVFPATRFFAHGEPLAMVLSSDDTCQMTGLWPNEGYSGGEAWVDNGSGWQLLSGLGYPDLDFTTLVVPARNLDYTQTWLGGPAPIVLGDGRLVIAAGSSIELYDPSTHTSTLGPVFSEPRGGHSVTRLADGRIAIIGGDQWDPNSGTTLMRATAEIYDPSTGQITTAAGLMTFPRSQHTATLLPNDLVLIAGGYGAPDPNQGGYRPPFLAAELFNPSTGQFTALTDPANLMVDTRWGHRATALANGTVLITGGWTDSWPMASAEIFDPWHNSFTPTTGEMVTLRGNHTVTLLTCPDAYPACSYGGQVLITGGHAVNFPSILSSAELYDPATGSFAAAGNLTRARQTHAAVQLDDGTVLVAGGSDTCCGQAWNGLASLERYDPAGGTFTTAGSMVVVRDGVTAVLLSDGRVALVGGGGTSVLPARSIELYTPADAVAITTTALPPATFGQGYGAALLVSGGSGPYTFTVQMGRLPDGLLLDPATGAITGTPTEAGTFQVTILVSDGSGRLDVQTVTLDVDHAVSLASTTPAGAVVGEAYSESTVVNGGTAPYAFAHVGGLGNLPPGLSLGASGVISGTPTATGSFSFVTEVRDGSAPQDVLAARLRMSVSTIDQRQDSAGATTWAIGPTENEQYLGVGQVVAVTQTGRVTGVRLQAGCSSGSLTVQIRQTAGWPLTPAGEVFASETFPAGSVPWPAGGLVGLQFHKPPFVRAGESFAIVLSSDGSCFVQQGPLGTDTYAAGNAVSYSSVDGWTATDSDLPFQTLIEPLSLSGSGTATADGVFAPNEWNGAAGLNFRIGVPGGGTIPGTLYVMNDATDLHVALVYERKHLELSGWFDLYFDSDANGDPIENGEDIIQLQIQPWWIQSPPNDRFQSTELGCAPWACHYDDAWQGGGTTDVAGRFGYDGEQVVLEMRHPLASGDVRDVSLEAGQAIALRLYHQLSAVGGVWPQDYGETNLPDRGGSIPLTIAPAGYRPPDRPFELRVTKTGHGSVTWAPGIRCAGDCLEYVADATPVTLTAAPLSGFGTSFIGWGGGCASFGAIPVCTLTITADTQVDAQFTWNWPPGANPQSVNTSANTPIVIQLTGGDGDGQQITFSIDTPPQHGDLSVVTVTGLMSAEVTYTPATGFTGSDSFTFTASDGTFTSGPAMVTVVVGGTP